MANDNEKVLAPILQAVAGKAPISDSVSEHLINRMMQNQLGSVKELRKGVGETTGRISKLKEQPKRKDISGMLAMGDALNQIFGGEQTNFAQLYQHMKPKDTTKELKDLESLLAKQRHDLSDAELGLLKQQFQAVSDEKDKLGDLTKGQEATDKAFGKEYADYFAGGGFADVEKGLTQLQEASTALGEQTNLTGPYLSMMPDFARRRAAQQSSAIQQTVEEVVQRNLKAVLGSQFTEKEGERLIARAYDPAMPEAENKKRVDRLIKQIRDAALAKQKAAEYFETNGTLKGFKGSTKYNSANDFLSDTKRKVGATPADGDTKTWEGKKYIKQGGNWVEVN